MTPAPWITNCPEAATKLKAADKAYSQAIEAARGLRLAEKIEAIRAAKASRQAAYDSAVQS